MRLKIKKTGSFKNSKRYIKLIENASVYDVAINSPITFAPNLSLKEKNKIFLKREDLQPIFSFKNRGAYNKIIRQVLRPIIAGNPLWSETVVDKRNVAGLVGEHKVK